ncbi:MAG: hypothetical protein QM726_04325 [Chitinophagaceae bacterium]
MHIKIILALYAILFSATISAQGRNDHSTWDMVANKNTTAIHVNTDAFNSDADFRFHIMKILKQLGYEFSLEPNAIITKDKIIFNNIHAIITVTIEDLHNCIITGQESTPAIGGLAWKEIKKGPDPIGSPAYEKLLVISEVLHAKKILYSRN